jgi:chloride channel 3/4/5
MSAGIFVPSLGVGACFGRLVGLGMKIVRWHYPDSILFEHCEGDQCNVSGIYAMVRET